MTILDREKGDMVEFVEHGASLTEPEANEHKSAQESGTTAAEAYKGDNSNGKVQWTVRKVFAAATLCGLYTCETVNAALARVSEKANGLYSVPNTAILRRRDFELHRC